MVGRKFQHAEQRDNFVKWIIDPIKNGQWDNVRLALSDFTSKTGVEVKVDDQLAAIKKMIDDGQFFTVAPPKQGESIADNLAKNSGRDYDKYQQVFTEGTQPTTNLSLEQLSQLLPTAKQYWLNLGVSAHPLDNIQLNIQDLGTNIAAVTNGNQITFDSTGAGWGWFVDSTPQESSEFNFNATGDEGIAFAGTDADGKLDLLSVLIHEMGHVLGLTDNNDHQDIMSGLISAGLRHLPTDIDKQAVLAAIDKKQNPYSGGFTGTPLTVSGVTRVAPPQHIIYQAPALANNTLITLIENNGAWQQMDGVLFNQNSATLQEGLLKQSRLGQVFKVSENDNFLQFTIKRQLTDANNAPDDAFEMALLNATTGQSVLGTTGLSRSDAALNIQGSGVQTMAQGITVTTNANGSQTYLVDLQGITAGTNLNLVFDLIGFGAADSQVTISDVKLINLPQVVDDAITINEDNSTTIAVLSNDINAQLTGFVPVLVAAPQHGQVVINADGTFSYTPNANYVGHDSFSYRLSDGVNQSNVAQVNIVINPINDAPVSASQYVVVDEDNTVTISLVATDIDSINLNKVIVAQPQHGNLSLNADGSYSYTPVANFNGTDSFSYVVNDGELDSAIATVSITVNAVNDEPVVANAQLTVLEDGRLSLNLVAQGSDVDGDSLSLVTVGQPLHGRIEQDANGNYFYIPNANFNGTDSFSFTISDGVATATGTATVNVVAVNDAPVSASQSVIVDEDNTVVISLVATDIDSINLVTSIVSQPQHGSLSLNADGTYSYTPVANFNGTDSFSYVVNDGELDSAIATVSITVNAVNDDPVVANAQLNVLEDGRLVLDLIAQGSDVDGDSLSLVTVGQPLNGRIEQDANGNYFYVPNANFNGADSFSFTISDGVATATGKVTVDVVAVNDAPIVNDFVATLQEDGQLIIDLTSVINDVDGDILTYNISTPQYGSLTQSTHGIYVYTPNANINGTEQLTVTASDGTVSSQGFIRLTIMAVNDAPIAVNDSISTPQGQAVVVNVLNNDRDVDSSTLTTRLVANAQQGTVIRNTNGTFTYTSNANFNGFDSFSYVVNDGLLDSNIATVTIQVIAKQNRAPVAVDDTITLNEDNTARFNPLFNDTDADGDNLIFRVLSQPTKGQIIVNSDNTISYTPNANYSGEDSFTYQVNDGQANSNVATVRLHIAAVADAPILTINNNNNSNPTRELFRTSWESVSDRNYTSTLVEQTQLEGWTLLTKPDNSRGGSNGFEVWSTDDRMADNLNRQRTVTAMAGNGNNWLELNNARNNMAQSLGIQRQVDTVTGATYTLSMDVAGRLGYSSDYTKIGIYVDGVRIGGDDSTSGNMALNWQTKQFSFVGNGRKQTIQILGEATKQDGNGRGMMIDDIILTERLANNTGLEDISIKLSAISARLKDDDGSEILALSIEAIPVGAILSDGTRSFTATSTNRTVNITTWNLSNLSLTPPKDFNGTINLQVKATATERSNGSTASTTETLSVKVLPVNDAPIAKNATFTVQRNGSVRIDFSQLVSDVDGDILSLMPDCPNKGTLSKNSDGSYTYTPRRNYTGTDSFTYTVNDGTSCVQATISLVVQNPNNDDDDCHRQSITIQSVYANNTANNTPSYVVINNNSTSPSSSIVNWDIFAPQVGITLQPQMLTSQEEETNLAVLTGLVVKKG